MSRNETCTGCKHFQPTEDQMGQCRQGPPTAYPMMAHDQQGKPVCVGVQSFWPPVHAAHWCGAYVAGIAIVARLEARHAN